MTEHEDHDGASSQSDEKLANFIAYGVPFGLIAGVIIGTLTGNIGFWISLGLTFGILGGVIAHSARRRTGAADPDAEE